MVTLAPTPDPQIVELLWSEPVDTDDLPITQYVVHVAEIPDHTVSETSNPDTLPWATARSTTSLHCTFPLRQPVSTICFRVFAHTSAGISDPSDTIVLHKRNGRTSLGGRGCGPGGHRRARGGRSVCVEWGERGDNKKKSVMT